MIVTGKVAISVGERLWRTLAVDWETKQSHQMRRQGHRAIEPQDAVALWRGSAPVRRVAVTAKCQLVTPMYGGGVTAGEVDRAMPIRASALRGQLRFWWRLLYGGGRASKDVFEEECAIWGGISAKEPRASQVRVRVDCEPIDHKLLVPAAHRDVPGYGLILDQQGPPAELLKQGYEFELTLEFDGEERRDQVLTALRWWANFGGVGARTRRGFGAVQATGVAGLNPVTRDEAESGGVWFLEGQPAAALQAWKQALQALQVFRQGAGVGRAGARRGRSNWPEAETIRRMAKGRRAEHRGTPFFPRAAFGLPIVFQFTGEAHLNDTLEGADHERMASPLILRPYFDGNAFRAMALLLPNWQKRISVPVKFKDSGRKGQAWPSGEEERSRLADSVEPMKPRGSDPLTAFMHYFAEITR